MTSLRSAASRAVGVLDCGTRPAGYGQWVELDGLIKYEKLVRPGQRASDVVVRERRRELLVQRLTGWEGDRLIWDDLRREGRTAARLHAFLAA